MGFRSMRLGPDAARYWIAAQGQPVARPFHLRWLLPAVCGTSLNRWWAVWGLSWPALGVGTFLLADGGWRGVLAAALVLGLPGVWGPSVVRPIGVDLPAMAVGVWAAVLASHGVWWAAVLAAGVAACIKESAPVWVALWAWNPILLLGLIPVAFTALVVKPQLDEVTAQPALLEVHDHPFRTAFTHRAPMSSPQWPWWRNAWVLAAPWGVCLAALYRPSWQTVAVLTVAYLQLLVATDTTRLLHTAAGPALAVAAASVIPVEWMLLAGVAHVFWWFKTEAV